MFPFPAAKIQPHASGMLERGMKTFAMPKRQEVHNILDDRQGSFSKLAYNHLGQNTVIRQRLQGELAQATILGESQRKIMQRVRRVTGQSIYQAKRVAQTERNRVQSQARWDAAQQAEQQGVRTYNEWRCRFVNSREAHMNRHGKRVMQGQTFPDSVMRYPGDPNGSAKEVINCHCYLQVGVLLHDETLDSEGKVVKLEQAPAEEAKQEKERAEEINVEAQDQDILENGGKESKQVISAVAAGSENMPVQALQNQAKSNIIKSDKQLGKKIGKHASDYGLDPAKPEDRAKMQTIIDTICETPDEIVYGTWCGQPGGVKFFIKGNDVVVTTKDDVFVTILKGGINNARVKDARRGKV